MFAKRLCCAGLALLASGMPARAADSAPDAANEARIFLLRYAELTATSDVAALDMYRDDAQINVSARWAGEEIEHGAAQGNVWKERLRRGWFDGTTRLEASGFQDASVTAQGHQLAIQAKRYSHTRCYWDNDYAVVIEPDSRGHYQIVEERLTFSRDATCSGQSEAAPVARAPVSAIGSPPIKPVRAESLPPNVVPSGQGLPRFSVE